MYKKKVTLSTGEEEILYDRLKKWIRDSKYLLVLAELAAPDFASNKNTAVFIHELIRKGIY